MDYQNDIKSLYGTLFESLEDWQKNHFLMAIETAWQRGKRKGMRELSAAILPHLSKEVTKHPPLERKTKN